MALFHSGLPRISRFLHRHSVLVLTYHDVLHAGFPDNNFLFGETVTTADFEWQLNFVLKYYRPVLFAEFHECLDGNKRLPSRSVLLTFDDGHRNNLTYALPRLKERGIPFTCFVVTSALGEQELLWFEEGFTVFRSQRQKFGGNGMANSCGSKQHRKDRWHSSSKRSGRSPNPNYKQRWRFCVVSFPSRITQMAFVDDSSSSAFLISSRLRRTAQRLVRTQ